MKKLHRFKIQYLWWALVRVHLRNMLRGQDVRFVLSNVTMFLPPVNEDCEGYIFTPVCQSFCSQRRVYTPWANTQAPSQQTPLSKHPPPRQIPPALRDTVNKRAVHILLECILFTRFLFSRWLSNTATRCSCVFKKKAFHSKANRSLSEVNKFEQVRRGGGWIPRWTSLNRSAVVTWEPP